MLLLILLWPYTDIHCNCTEGAPEQGDGNERTRVNAKRAQRMSPRSLPYCYGADVTTTTSDDGSDRMAGTRSAEVVGPIVGRGSDADSSRSPRPMLA